MMKLLLLITIVFTSCSKDDANSSISTNCDYSITLSTEEYTTFTSTNISIIDAKIIDDCLHIDYAASGCDGSSWNVELIASEEILETSPIQRMVKLKLINEELCTAVINKSNTFNVSSLQDSNAHTIKINIEGLDDLVEYNY